LYSHHQIPDHQRARCRGRASRYFRSRNRRDPCPRSRRTRSALVTKDWGLRLRTKTLNGGGGIGPRGTGGQSYSIFLSGSACLFLVFRVDGGGEETQPVVQVTHPKLLPTGPRCLGEGESVHTMWVVDSDGPLSRRCNDRTSSANKKKPLWLNAKGLFRALRKPVKHCGR